jgi:hypothetical protein
MFGDNWEPAHGKLLDVRYGGKHGDWSGNDSRTANSVHYLMEIQPDAGGESFRCECEPPSLMMSFKTPPMDTSIKMECIASKQKARFDRDEPAISNKEAKKNEQAAYNALLHGDK